MAKSGDSVLFKHFRGTLAQWEDKINTGAWTDAIVFGIIHDGAGNVLEKRIYGGTDSLNNQYSYMFNDEDTLLYWDDTDCDSDLHEE